MDTTKDWLELAAAAGVSGAEEPVRQVVMRRLGERSQWAWVDALGNLVVPVAAGPSKTQGASRPRLVLSAPLDEPGLVVTHIDAAGWLRVDVVGELPAARLEGRVVLFESRESERRPVAGIVGIDRRQRKAVDGHEIHDEEWRAEDLFVDIGAISAQQAASLVPLGSVGIIETSDVRNLGEMFPGVNRWLGRTVGRRLLVEVLLHVFARPQIAGEPWLLFAAQSLLHGRGVEGALANLRPQYYIPLLPIPAEDWPVSARDGEIRLGQGPVLIVEEGDGVSDRQLLALAHTLAQANGIPVQWRAASTGGSNDLGEGLWVRGGVRTLGLGLPVRMRTGMAEMVDQRDADGLERLLTALLGAMAEPS